jgi:hypothetical protein
MRRHKYFALWLLAAPAMLLPAGGQAQSLPQPHRPPAAAPEPEHPAIEPAAIAMLQATSKRLAGLKSMTFTVVSTYESIARTGQSLFFTTQSEVTVQRPNKLRVLTPGDGPASNFYYDGKTMTAYAPDENLVAVADAPATMEAMLRAAYDQAAIYFPFSVILADDPYKNLSDGLTSAFVVGQSHLVDGVVTDMVAFTNKNVHGEIWIGVDDGLPRMYRVNFLNDPQHLHYQVDLYDWHPNVKLGPGDFTSAEALKAPHMKFDRPDAPAKARTN